MKTKIIEKKKEEEVVPCIGEYWRHKGGFNVYRRMKKQPHIFIFQPAVVDSTDFISYNLTTNTIAVTPRGTPVEILKPIGFEDDTMIFEVI